MSDVVIRAEGLGKKYIIGHQSNERYTALRDVLAQQARRLIRSARDMAAGRALIMGDEREEFWALKDVNFEIRRGEVVGIIGRNGAGKSTLLKVLSRITEPSEGRVTIDGRVASLLEVGTGFHPELTGRENIYLNGAILGMTRAEIRRKFDEIVAFAGVEKFLDTPVKRYSSGMYVRLAFSVAAHLEPEILVVDEVLAVGDAEFQKKCLGKMQDVAGQGRTVLFVSHNMLAIEALCQRGLMLQRGQVTVDADAASVVRFYRQSADMAVRTSARPENEMSLLKEVAAFGRIERPKKSESAPISSGAPMVIEAKLSFLQETPPKYVEVAVGIRKLDGQKMLYLGTKVVDSDLREPAGEIVLRCTVPRLPLEEGIYAANIEIKKDGVIAEKHEEIIVFEVAPGNFYGTGRVWPYGGFLTDYRWEKSINGRNLQECIEAPAAALK